LKYKKLWDIFLTAFSCNIVWDGFVSFGGMKKYVLYTLLGVVIISGVSACKAKHCAAREDGMEGYNSKKAGKKKRGRQEGLFGKQRR